MNRPGATDADATPLLQAWSEGDATAGDRLMTLSLDETATVLQISRATVDLDWRAARAWLYQQLTNGS